MDILQQFFDFLQMSVFWYKLTYRIIHMNPLN